MFVAKEFKFGTNGLNYIKKSIWVSKSKFNINRLPLMYICHVSWEKLSDQIVLGTVYYSFSDWIMLNHASLKIWEKKIKVTKLCHILHQMIWRLCTDSEFRSNFDPVLGLPVCYKFWKIKKNCFGGKKIAKDLFFKL